jgi:hypothetical protein
VKAATAMLKGDVKLGEDGSAYVETAMGPKVLGDYVKQWAAGEGAAFVSPPKGGGAKPGAGGQPQKKPEEMSAQERADLFKTDPEAFYRAFPQAKRR